VHVARAPQAWLRCRRRAAHADPPIRARSASQDVDGLLAVPIDIRTVRAQFRFDVAGRRGAADATIEYVVGPTAGHPVFDLRQTMVYLMERDPSTRETIGGVAVEVRIG
jgi:hypothetical protein